MSNAYFIALDILPGSIDAVGTLEVVAVFCHGCAWGWSYISRVLPWRT